MTLHVKLSPDLRSWPIALAIGMLSLVSAFNLEAQIYRWTDESGAVHFSDCPPQECANRAAAPDPDPQELEQARQRARELIERARLVEPRRAPPSQPQQAEAESAKPEASLPPVVDPFAAKAACFSAPPTWRGGPDLSALETPPSPVLAPEQHQGIKQSLIESTGLWRGKVLERVCLGNTEQIREDLRSFLAILDSIREGSEVQRLEISLQNARSEISKDELFWLSVVGAHLHAGDIETAVETAERWRVSVLDINGLTQEKFTQGGRDELVFRFSRAFRKKLRNASVWQLELRKFRLRSSQLDIDELFYSQGQLAGSRHFRLTR